MISSISNSIGGRRDDRPVDERMSAFGFAIALSRVGLIGSRELKCECTDTPTTSSFARMASAGRANHLSKYHTRSPLISYLPANFCSACRFPSSLENAFFIEAWSSPPLGMIGDDDVLQPAAMAARPSLRWMPHIGHRSASGGHEQRAYSISFGRHAFARSISPYPRAAPALHVHAKRFIDIFLVAPAIVFPARKKPILFNFQPRFIGSAATPRLRLQR